MRVDERRERKNKTFKSELSKEIFVQILKNQET